MNSLLLAARDLRLLIGNPRGPLAGQSFIHKLECLKSAHGSGEQSHAPQALRELEKIIQKAKSLLQSQSGAIPLSYALRVLSDLEGKGLIPSPSDTISESSENLEETVQITPILPPQILDHGITTTVPYQNLDKIITSPRTNKKGFFIVGNTAIDDFGRESSTQTVSRYVLGNWSTDLERYLPIASGGSSEVYFAHEHGTPRPVAIKIAAIRNPRDRQMILNRFQNGQYFQSLLGADRFVHYYETGILPDGTPFIVMELMKESIYNYIQNREKDHQPLTPPEAFGLGVRMIAPVAIMHTKQTPTSRGPIEGIVHRDIKLENFLFSSDKKVKLSDFDLARHLIDLDQDSSDDIQGTPGYFVHTEPDSFGRDVFALGTLLYILFTGHEPFSGNSFIKILMSVLGRDNGLLQEQLAQQKVPRPIADIIMRALSLNREERHSNAAELFFDFATLKARALEAEARRFLELGSDPQQARGFWRLKIEESLGEYELAYQEYSHPAINEKMINLHKELHDYASAVGDQELVRYAIRRIGRLTPRGLPRVETRS